MTPHFPLLQTAALAVVVAAVVLLGRVRDYTLSDPQLTLLTAQVLWERGSLDLRPELDRLGPKEFAKDSWKYSINKQGQVFYGYPLGTTLLTLPVVAVGRTLGSDLSVWETDRRYQIGLAALSCASVFALLANLGWILTRDRMAPPFAFLVTLGSSLISTLGSALWSFDFELVLCLLALREVALAEAGSTPRALRAGVFIASAWICRPSAITLALPLGLFILTHGLRTLVTFIGGMAGVIVPFLLFCKATAGAFLPPYYIAGNWIRVANFEAWPANLEAILFSPARGLFTFTPSLLFGIFALGLASVRQRPMARVLAGWAALTTAIVATQRNWWGGWSFGPRLLTEVAPGLALLALMGWQAAPKGVRRRIMLVAALSFGWGVFVHTGQGLLLRAAYSWNNRPNIDAAPEYYRRNWRFPQFLATASRNEAKAQDHAQ